MNFYAHHGIALQQVCPNFQHGEIHIQSQNLPVHFFVLSGLDRICIDAWADAVILAGQKWQNGEIDRFLAIHDFSSIPMLTAITPYLRSKSTETMDAMPDLTGRVVIVAQDNPLVRAFGAKAGEYFMQRKMPNLKTCVMFDLDKALEWVRAT